MKKKKERKFSVLKICLSVSAVLMITAFGTFLLHYDMSALMEQPESVYEPTASSVSASVISQDSPSVPGRTDLNLATIEELEELPGIGEALARRIVTYREEKPFKVPRDLKKIEGIGDKKYDGLKDLVCVGEEIET